MSKVKVMYVGKHLGEGFEIDGTRYDSRDPETGAPAVIEVPGDHLNFLTVGSGRAWKVVSSSEVKEAQEEAGKPAAEQPATTNNKK
jgi:hypothetical protein